jgi:NAD(P)-dependent dehydrogenase (short-subunit alcohol dehydrogenase family)
VDVSDAAAFERAADEAEAEFGNVHFLFNNAGVSLGAMPLWEMTPAQWEWIFGVNVQGVINGIRTWVPRMRRHGEAGRVVNTASIGGLQVNPKLRNGSYAMTKYAIVAASEALALDLEDSAIGVSVLCPALVNTTLHASSRRRPARLGGPYEREGADAAKAWQSAGLSPDDVGRRVLDAVARSEFFIFTHEEPRAWIEGRHARILAGFDSITRYNAAEHAT